LSFGIAGGLESGLTPRDIIVAHTIRAANGKSWNCDPALVNFLKERVAHHRDGTVYGSTFLVPTPREKKKLYRETSCTLVDMESHIVAEVATEHGLPFAVLRGVSDSINDTFPKAALVAVNEDGSPNNQAMYRSILANPFQLPSLLKLFKHSRISLERLSEAIQQVAA
jgi:nucleoside phosphorylase